MIFKEWFEMFYNAYCVDVIAYDCYKDYYYINQKHFGYIADMELLSVKPIDIQNCLKSTLSYSNDRQRRSYFYLNVYSVKLQLMAIVTKTLATMLNLQNV